ncbi:MAG: FG-GAP-like repeat-containing protein [Microthrixaceae bacterium]|nr:FG-GAP-like repeat-containing protein [Microthrixaceae bacterium]
MTSPEVLIFLAFMITDPKTTPSGRIQRIAFGGMVGVLAALFVAPFETELRVKLAILASLVVGCAARTLVERWIPADSTTLSDGTTWLGERGRRIKLATALAVGPVAVLLVASSLSTVEGLVATDLSDQDPDGPSLLTDEDLPPVIVDPSAEDLNPAIDEARAKGLALDVLNALEAERQALREGDANLAARSTAGSRLEDIQKIIASDAKAELASYRFDSMTVLMNRLTPQSPPALTVRAEGIRQIDETEQPFVETFHVEPNGENFLIVAPNPTLDYDVPGEGPESETEPATAVPPVIPDGWLDPAVLGGLHLTDATEAAGLDAPQADPADWPNSPNLFAGGAAAEDYDLDGDIDLFLPRTGLPNKLYRNNGDGTFTDVAESADLEGPPDGSGDGVPIWGDIDGDRDLDLLVTSASGPRVLLFVNRGDGTFVEAAEDHGIFVSSNKEFGLASYGAAFGDVDQDRDLDLVIAQWGEESLEPQASSAGTSCAGEQAPVSKRTDGSGSRLLLNNGDGKFSDATGPWDLKLDSVFAFQPTFADYDADGWPDLLMTGDFCTSRVFRNLEGTGFADVTDTLGVGTDENGMGSVVADINGDGLLDWFVTSISYPTADDTCPLGSGCSGNRLYLNTREGVFRDATDRYALRDGYWGWGAVIADLNNDGHSDVVQANGHDSEAYFAHDPTTVWINPGQPPLVRATRLTGISDTELGKAVVTFDYDNDGDLDLFIANTGSSPRLWRNDLPKTDNWVQVRLVDSEGRDPRGVGARVEVEDGPGSSVRVAEVRASGSFQSQDPTTVHFGLGEGTGQRLVSVRVFWPGDANAQVEQVQRGVATVIERQ